MEKAIGNYLLLKTIILITNKKIMNDNNKANLTNIEEGDELESKRPITIENKNLIESENIIENNEESHSFGWSQYSEITNGRFAMIGFLAIIIIELISNKSFLTWAGIMN